MDKDIATEITVLMPVCNAAQHLSSAIQSILSQTYQNFEFLIINDGSTDTSEDIIKSFKDARIRYIKFNKNKGIAACLNYGITKATGRFIARMDADDIADKTRLEKQVTFLNKNTDIDVLGCHINLINVKDEVIGELLYSTKHHEIKVDSLFFCPVPHPGVMLRKKSFEQANLLYDINYLHVEDYELWQRALATLKFSNYNQKLLNYRISDSQVSIIYAVEQQGKADEIKQRYLYSLNPSYSKREIKLLTGFLNGNIVIENTDQLKTLLTLLNNIVIKNKSAPIFDDQTLTLHIVSQLDKLLRFYTHKNNKLYTLYKKDNLSRFSTKPLYFKLIMYLKEWIS